MLRVLFSLPLVLFFFVRNADAGQVLKYSEEGTREGKTYSSVLTLSVAPEGIRLEAAAVREAVGRLAATARALRAYPEAAQLLVAFLVYNDGIGTIIKMATIYGVEVGLQDKDLMGALLMVQIVAAPASVAFGRLAAPLGPRGAVLLGIAGYTGISVFAYFLRSPWQFWTLAALVALFQGGTQALSRSMCSLVINPALKSTPNRPWPPIMSSSLSTTSGLTNTPAPMSSRALSYTI